jgi:hypothetical protein
VAAWHEEPINKRHNREALDCGEEALNEFTALSVTTIFAFPHFSQLKLTVENINHARDIVGVRRKPSNGALLRDRSPRIRYCGESRRSRKK